MNEPASNLIRIGEIQLWARVSRRQLLDLATSGQLGGAALWPGGRRYFLREVARHVLFGAPLASPFGPEPEPELLRARDVLDWTGLRDDQFRWAEGHMPASLTLTLRQGGKRLYRKHAVRAHFFEPLLPKHVIHHRTAI